MNILNQIQKPNSGTQYPKTNSLKLGQGQTLSEYIFQAYFVNFNMLTS
jgi:hypothetical protein